METNSLIVRGRKRKVIIDDDNQPARTEGCLVCYKTYKHPKTLKRHMLSCLLDQKFACSECDTSFSRKDILTRHVAEKHSDGDQVECMTCGNTIGRRYLDKHWETEFCISSQRQKEDDSVRPLRKILADRDGEATVFVTLEGPINIILAAIWASCWHANCCHNSWEAKSSGTRTTAHKQYQAARIQYLEAKAVAVREISRSLQLVFRGSMEEVAIALSAMCSFRFLSDDWGEAEHAECDTHRATLTQLPRPNKSTLGAAKAETYYLLGKVMGDKQPRLLRCGRMKWKDIAMRRSTPSDLENRSDAEDDDSQRH